MEDYVIKSTTNINRKSQASFFSYVIGEIKMDHLMTTETLNWNQTGEDERKIYILA